MVLPGKDRRRKYLDRAAVRRRPADPVARVPFACSISRSLCRSIRTSTPTLAAPSVLLLQLTASLNTHHRQSRQSGHLRQHFVHSSTPSYIRQGGNSLYTVEPPSPPPPTSNAIIPSTFYCLAGCRVCQRICLEMASMEETSTEFIQRRSMTLTTLSGTHHLGDAYFLSFNLFSGHYAHGSIVVPFSYTFFSFTQDSIEYSEQFHRYGFFLNAFCLFMETDIIVLFRTSTSAV